MNRTDLIDTVWQIKDVKESGVTYADIEQMDTDDLLTICESYKVAPKIDVPRGTSVSRKPKTKPVKQVKPVMLKREMCLHNNDLYWRETWEVCTDDYVEQREHLIHIPSKYLTIDGVKRPRKRVIQGLKTGIWDRELPLPFKGEVIVDGNKYDLGRFYTKEERDEAVQDALMGRFRRKN